MLRDDELIAALENYRLRKSRLSHFERYKNMDNDTIELVIRPAGWFRKERWFWRIVSPNGQILATSEMYKSRQACELTSKRQVAHHNYDFREITEGSEL